MREVVVVVILVTNFTLVIPFLDCHATSYISTSRCWSSFVELCYFIPFEPIGPLVMSSCIKCDAFFCFVFRHMHGYSFSEELVPRFAGHVVHMRTNLDYIRQQVLQTWKVSGYPSCPPRPGRIEQQRQMCSQSRWIRSAFQEVECFIAFFFLDLCMDCGQGPEFHMRKIADYWLYARRASCIVVNVVQWMYD